MTNSCQKQKDKLLEPVAPQPQAPKEQALGPIGQVPQPQAPCEPAPGPGVQVPQPRVLVHRVQELVLEVVDKFLDPVNKLLSPKHLAWGNSYSVTGFRSESRSVAGFGFQKMDEPIKSSQRAGSRR